MSNATKGRTRLSTVRTALIRHGPLVLLLICLPVICAGMPAPKRVSRLRDPSMPDIQGRSMQADSSFAHSKQLQRPAYDAGFKADVSRALDEWGLKEDGRWPALLTRAVARDAPHRLRLGNDGRMAYKPGIDTCLNRKHRPPSLDRSRHAGKIRAVIDGRADARSLGRRRLYCHTHAVMASSTAAAGRQICLTLRAKSEEGRRQWQAEYQQQRDGKESSQRFY